MRPGGPEGFKSDTNIIVAYVSDWLQSFCVPSSHTRALACRFIPAVLWFAHVSEVAE